jgi:mRNA interferase RelE/StbE
VTNERYDLVISPTARRQLAEYLPESVAFAAYEFIVGPLPNKPQRVGKRLRPPLDDRHSARRGTYRVIFRIDDIHHRVTVVGVVHRHRFRVPISDIMSIDVLRSG